VYDELVRRNLEAQHDRGETERQRVPRRIRIARAGKTSEGSRRRGSLGWRMRSSAACWRPCWPSWSGGLAHGLTCCRRRSRKEAWRPLLAIWWRPQPQKPVLPSRASDGRGKLCSSTPWAPA
jgi:hypothetical protein